MLKTHSSSGNKESSENNKYKYCKAKRKVERDKFNKKNKKKLLQAFQLIRRTYLKCLSKEKALLNIILLRWIAINILDSTIATLSAAVFL